MENIVYNTVISLNFLASNFCESVVETVSSEFQENCPKLRRNCEFPQNFYTRKLGESLAFYAVITIIYVRMNKWKINWGKYFLIGWRK